MLPLQPGLQTAGVSFFQQLQIELALRNYKTKAQKSTYIIFEKQQLFSSSSFNYSISLSKIKLILLCTK